jgi:hypothetical protein
MQTRHRPCPCHSKDAYFQIRLDGIDCRMGMNRPVCPPDSRGYRAPEEKLERKRLALTSRSAIAVESTGGAQRQWRPSRFRPNHEQL